MPSLRILDVSGNQLEGNIPRTKGGALCNLQSLDLSSNNITGEMAGLIDGLSLCYPNLIPKLTVLNLAHNSLSGNISKSIEKLSSLEVLYLQSNELSGDLPESLGQLHRLTILNVSSNFFTGVVSEAHFAKLSRLKALYMSFNSLSLKVSSNWVPPFQLDHIYMSSCQLGPPFPSWLHTQTGISNLDISNASISDAIPDWFWLITSDIVSLNLSFNQINGMLPVSMDSISITFMDLCSNQLEGPIPKLHPDIQMLHLNDNSFEGTLPSDLGHEMPMLRSLQLSNNLLNGSIPESFCDLKQLLVLWLAGNHLTGTLPDCWSKLQALQIMDLGNNSLSGTIPASVGSLNSLVSLHLNANNLTGEIPTSLQNCTRLNVLDLSDNHLSGGIPAWIGESLRDLIILRLRSNNFDGRIPDELSHLSLVRVFDISINNLSGTIPRSLGNLTSMIEVQNSGDHLRETWNGYKEHVMVCISGRQFAYSNTLSFVTNLDISSNKLVGEIPDEVTKLLGLLVLNLSNNGLTGEIPQRVGDLNRLLSLDLSRNSLSGHIPSSMSDLTSLSHLNLSYNRLTGEIPTGFQLQTLNYPSIYIGNEGLCGPPLTDGCQFDDKPTSSYAASSDEDGSEMLWFYSGVPAGFVVGVTAIFGVLLLQETWRIEFFHLIDTMYDWL
ncbi:receptor-like protein EIX2 [Typha latifolia]|uniref:receptor-like protein EIX2 n=1 Tax=Typha latifolia TaxID=4733 RepID=UPI003C2ACC63